MAKKRTKLPDVTDKHVGNRVRLRRMVVGKSQTAVATALGITFQQIQKYEAGKNRIAASRLHRLAELLGVKPGFFFEDAAGHDFNVSPSPDYVTEFLSTADGVALMNAFKRVSTPQLRRRLVGLVQELADREDASPENGDQSGGSTG